MKSKVNLTDREELKTIKVKASTHARLAVMSAMLNQSIAELIDELLEKTYPEIVAETDRAMNRVRSLKQKSDAGGE
jgi:nucleosome binding factor SPN SPT16 subunit